MSKHQSKYPSTFYRVSVKALIKNEVGHVLVCKENQDHWSLPGGGIDHDESPLAALARELDEELGIIDITATKLSSVRTVYVDSLDSWLMWVTYEVKIGSNSLVLGPGVTEATFIDTDTFKDSPHRSEQLVYASVQEASQH